MPHPGRALKGRVTDMNTRRQKLRRTFLALLFLALPITLNYFSSTS